MIALLVAAIFVPVAFGLSFVVSRMVHRRKREASPQPKAPRDLDRPYPRPKGHRSRLNRVCPVCGAGKETAAMDARVLGWPAHGACADWLGDWEPGKIPSEDADGPQPDFAPGRPEGVTPPDAKPGQAGRCYCNWCQGRPGVHGAEAVALYRAQVSAAMAGPGPVAWSGTAAAELRRRERPPTALPPRLPGVTGSRPTAPVPVAGSSPSGT